MKLLLFGQIGSGKSHVGALLAQEFGFHYHDADTDLPGEIVDAIRRHAPLTDDMRDQFAERIATRLEALSASHSNFVVAQALFKDRQRSLLLARCPSLHLVWVRSTPVLIAARLKERTGHIASAYYADVVNPVFEAPTVPHLILDNLGDSEQLRLALIELLATANRTAKDPVCRSRCSSFQ
jgi:carbohydrate kinase (thermoresistant glucokinase family)